MEKYYKMTLDELLSLQEEISSNPCSRTGAKHPYLYNSQTRNKLNKIGWAIQSILDERKKQQDPTWSYSGYTGRNCK